jgi:His/Glu/Gln/Arg/opine family amino acid ABC transporter permease subunit
MFSKFSKKIILAVILLALGLSFNALEAPAKEPFKVALTGKYPPFSFYSQQGELIGFDVDVSRKIADYLGRDLEIITTEWDSILAGLLVGKYDAIIGSMAITPQRAQQVNFSDPYYQSGAQLFINKKDKEQISNIKDLYGHKVGVGLGETYEHYLSENHPQVDIVTYKSAPQTYQDMLNQRLKGFVTDRLVGLYQIKQGDMPFVPAGSLLYKEKMAIPVAKDNPQLLSKINKALTKMRQNGELDELHKKWFGAETGQVDSAVEGAMQPKVIAVKLIKGFAVTLLVAFFAILFGFSLSVPFGILLNKSRSLIYFILRSLNDFIRGTPLLIQLFFVYFGAPQVGVTFTPIQAAIFTLTLNASAYMAEVIRSGLMAVSRGQRLAARAIGLNNWQVFIYVVWPQAFRVALPPLMNVVVALMKDTALIAMISVAEVIRQAQSIISITYNPIKYYFIVGLMFFAFTFPMMKLASKLERSIKRRGFQ